VVSTGPPPIGLDALGPGRVLIRNPDGSTDLLADGVRARCTDGCEAPPRADRSEPPLRVAADGALEAVRTDDGSVLARIELDAPVVAQSSVADAIFVALADGRVVEVEPELLLVLGGETPPLPTTMPREPASPAPPGGSPAAGGRRRPK
jgi:hypothetical protein